jgi:hypothetical protein
MNESSDFWLQKKSPIQQTLEKHPTKFSCVHKENIQYSITGRPLTVDDVDLIGILCFEGGLNIDPKSIRFNLEGKIVFTKIDISSEKNFFSDLCEDLPHYKQTSMFLQGMKITKELSLADFASSEVKKALRKIQKEKFYEIRGILDLHTIFPIVGYALFGLVTFPWNDPTFISAAVTMGAYSFVHSTSHIILRQKAYKAFNEYLIPKAMHDNKNLYYRVP